MNHITQSKRRTRIMWLIVVLIWIAVLSYLGNIANMPEIECFTDSCVQCVDDCLKPLTK